MNRVSIFACLSAMGILLSCADNKGTGSGDSLEADTLYQGSLEEPLMDPANGSEDTSGADAYDPADSLIIEDSLSQRPLVVLTSNALQLVSPISGSSSAIEFGTEETALVNMLRRSLRMEPTSTGQNKDCGAGTLKMTSWINGLTVVFQENRHTVVDNETEWQFAGWYLTNGPSTVPALKLTTMAGIGIGSTRAEMEDAYVIEVSETSLGYEFSTKTELYGILDGAGKDAKITTMWSGLNCSFR